MQVILRFYPASQSGKRTTMDSVIRDLRYRNVVYGIQMNVLQDHFMSDGIYGTDLIVAKGKEPRHGTDASVRYYFNTDVHAQPTLKDDGTVDYFHLNMINPCRKGQLLAEIIPEDEGEYGITVQGAKIRPRQVKKHIWNSDIILKSQRTEKTYFSGGRSCVTGRGQSICIRCL